MQTPVTPGAAPEPSSRRKGESYADSLNRTLGEMIDGLTDLPPERKSFLKHRWLDQVVWMETGALAAVRKYYTLRITALVCGLVIPVLAGLSLDGRLGDYAQYAIVALGLLVALSTGLEELFKYGDRWRHYRQTVEFLKIEGWRFLQLTDPYSRFQSHTEAYPHFADQVEDMFRREVQGWISRVATDRDQGKDAGDKVD